MGEEETMTEVAEPTSNGTATLEDKVEDVPQTKEEEIDGAKEMEEDIKGYVKVETQKMDVDQEGGENEETEEKKKEGKQSKEEEDEDTKEGTRSDYMEEEMKAKENGESDEKGEEKVDVLKEEYEMDEESKQEKGSKGCRKGKTPGIKAKSNKKEEDEEKLQKIHVASSANRPVRARKSVYRLVESFELHSVKEFHIEKGYGTALKDIPNVAFKLSKRRTDDTLKLLHTILFGRRGKEARVKSHIYQFSGFVLTENEEKQKIKMKEKLDKCVKEKLLGFCDVLDIPIAKSDTTKTNTRKEDIVAKLIDFLVAPQATTTELLSEQSGKKRKRVGKQNASMSRIMSLKGSAKKNKMTEKVCKEREKNGAPEREGKLEEEEKRVRERSRNDLPDHSDSEESKDEFESNMIKDKPVSKNSSAKKESGGKEKTKKVDIPKKSNLLTERTPLKSSSNVFDVDVKIDKSPKTFSQEKVADGKVKTEEVETLKKPSTPTEKSTVKSSSKCSEVNERSDTNPKTFSRKKKAEVVVMENSFTQKKHDSVEKIGKKVVKGKNQPKEHKLRPSDDELRNAVCDVLKEVDFNTATFIDILKQLAWRYNTDLTSRKSSIKIMVRHELTKLADEEDDEEDG